MEAFEMQDDAIKKCEYLEKGLLSYKKLRERLPIAMEDVKNTKAWTARGYKSFTEYVEIHLAGILQVTPRTAWKYLQANVDQSDEIPTNPTLSPTVSTDSEIAPDDTKNADSVSEDDSVDSAMTETDFESEQEPEPETPLDRKGNEIPENLRQMVASIEPKMDQLASMINVVLKTLKDVYVEDDPWWGQQFNKQRFENEIKAARRDVRFAKPFMVCPYCHGNGGLGGKCRGCEDFGMITEGQYRLLPKEMK